MVHPSVQRRFPPSAPAGLSLMAALLAACSLLPGGASPTTTYAPAKIKLGVLPYVSSAPLYIAQEEGYYAEQNLEVEFVPFDNSSVLLPALEQGQIDVSADSPVAGIFNAMTATGNIKITADRGYLDPKGCTYGAILVTADWAANNPTPTADSLRGLKASVDPKTFNGFILDTALQPLGLTIADLATQVVPPASVVGVAESGDMDMFVLTEPSLTRLLATKKWVVWKTYQETVPDFQFGFVLYGSRLSKTDPALGDRFMTAYLKAVRQYNQGKTDRNVEIIAKFSKQDPAFLKSICWPAFHSDGNMNLTPITDFEEWAVGKGLIDKVVPADVLFDPRFVDAANKTLGAKVP